MIPDNETVFTKLSLKVESAELAPVVSNAEALSFELDANFIEIERADPEGGWTGFLISVGFARSLLPGESSAEALRQAARPALVKFGIDSSFVTIYGQATREVRLYFDFSEFTFGNYIIFGLSTKFGVPEIEESSYVTRLDFTPRQDQDVISRVHLRVLEAGVSAALTRCLPIAERMQASYVRVVAQDGGFCEVALLSAWPVAEGAEPERELRSAADRLAAQFGASERGFEFRDGPYGLTGVLETEPVEFMQGLWLRALYVRADDDPLYVEPVYDES